MASIEEIIGCVSHRPWDMPRGQWAYYQEWNHTLFLHWKVDISHLRKLVPSHLSIDTFEGEAWISVVPFTMEQIRPRGLPAVGFLSNFEEINVRTYVTNNGRSGVYFLSIEAGRPLSALVARLLSGLPYEQASISRVIADSCSCKSFNEKRGFRLAASFVPGEQKSEKDALTEFLTERYCLYLVCSGHLYRYDIHHKPWQLREVKLFKLGVCYQIGGLTIEGEPHLVHYSDGVKVIAWNRERLT